MCELPSHPTSNDFVCFHPRVLEEKVRQRLSATVPLQRGMSDATSRAGEQRLLQENVGLALGRGSVFIRKCEHCSDHPHHGAGGGGGGGGGGRRVC